MALIMAPHDGVGGQDVSGPQRGRERLYRYIDIIRPPSRRGPIIRSLGAEFLQG